LRRIARKHPRERAVRPAAGRLGDRAFDMAEWLRGEQRAVRSPKSEKQQQRKCAREASGPSLVLRFVAFHNFCVLTSYFSHQR
jgi:hypothetical protein